MAEIEQDWLPTRQTLLSRLKNWEDADSWREFFDTYSKLIYSVARRSGLTDAEAQEVVQETMVTVANKMPDFKYDPGKGSFKGWLKNTTRWKVQDQFRRHQRQARWVESSPTSTEAHHPAVPESDPMGFESVWTKEWEDHLMKTAVTAVKQSVTPQAFQVFDLCTLKGWPPTRVARALNLFRPQVYYLNRKVSKLLQSELNRLQSS